MKRFLLIIGAILLGLAARGQSVTYTCRYWFDMNYAQAVTTTFGESGWDAEIDVGSLTEGIHSLHLHVMDTSMKWSAPQSYLFLKTDAIVQGGICVYHCWFDDDFDHQQSNALGNGHFLLDVANLEDGLHAVNVMLEGSQLTATQSYLFMKMAVEDPSTEMQYICWFDQDYSSVQTGSLGSGLFELEVSDLPNGIHTVNVQLSNGTRTAPQCYLFYKQPLGGYGIARWEYWLNEDIANRQITNISPTVDTLDIISLLNVGHPALRSSCFHFHPNGDEPYINAKNQINFRFYDSELRLIDKSAYYVDEQVQQDIVATVFERNTTETFAAPRNNQIQWFKVEVGIGDSLAFKADKACTMQLFAPSGEEVYAATASEAMEFGGCHVWEDGTYYLAVHDQMGSGETLSVTYNHLDRYVILACSPESVGNAIGSSFSFYYIGNGLKSIENIYLTHEGDTLTMDTIPYSTISRSYALFNIVDVIPNGVYDACFVFSDSTSYEVVEYANALTLEEPIYGDIEVSYNSPSQMAKPFPLTITFKNTGNVDYSYIPFNIAFDNLEGVEQINFEDFLIVESEESADSGFMAHHITNNLFNGQVDGCMIFSMIPSLSAHNSITYTVSFNAPAHSRFNLWAWTDLSLEQEMLLHPDSVMQFGERCSNTISTIELLGDNPFDVKRILPNPYRDDLEQETRQIGNGMKRRVRVITHIRIPTASVSNSVEWKPKILTHVNNSWCADSIPATFGPGMFCNYNYIDYTAFGFRLQRASTSLIPNPGTPYSVHVVVPGDPNDIHGYLSESGSHYMRQEIQNIHYEIEFENDTTLATAAAHTIIVRDTLDASRFDLNSLAVHSVTIGDKRLELNGEQNFARTLDMRPELYVIAQINQDYDPTTGIVAWTIQSLDPMTMEPTDNPYQGVLPVNYYGNGIGFIDYSINLKQTFDDGTEVSNRAGIIFDQEDIIMTPTCTNVVDAVKPTSYIENVTFETDTLNFSFVSSDSHSGVWYHTLYYRNDSTEMEWQVKKAQIFENNYMLRFNEYQTTEYLVMAVDSAGNVEDKEMVAEYVHYFDGPVPTCQSINLSQGWNWVSFYVEYEDAEQALLALEEALGEHGLKISAMDDYTTYEDGEWGAMGDLEELTNDQMYMVLVDDDIEVTLVGMPSNPADYTITILPNNWTWIGFPSAEAIAVEDAFANFEAEDGDKIQGVEDYTKYEDGEWGAMGDLEELTPGSGYMYFSNGTQTKTLVIRSGSKAKAGTPRGKRK